MSEPLSKQLGIKRKEVDYSQGHAMQRRTVGYNDCIDGLDQLSPDVEALTRIIMVKNIGTTDKNDTELAQEIINKMNKWIVKKG